MWTVLLALAVAQVSPETGSTGAFHDELARAKQLIFAGDPPQAREILEALATRLEAGEQPPMPLAFESLVYLGDLQFTEGDTGSARETFRSVLLEDPEHTISPYHHSEDVRAFFALLRERVRKELAAIPVPEPQPPPPVPERRRLPLWGYMPFGVPQLRQQRPVAGLGYAAAQGLFAAGSIGTYVWIVTVNRNPDKHPLGWTEDQVGRRVQTVRFGAQLPLTAAFYATWGLSVLDGAGTWSRTQRTQVSLRVTPGQVTLSGTF